MARLGDICQFQSGGTPSKNNASYFGGTIPWITTVALNGSSIGSEVAAEWITLDAVQESAAKIVPANSIMVGTRVGVGKVAINQVSMSTNQDIISLLDIDETKWVKGFLCKFIQSKHEYLNSQARGATIKGIKIDIISALELPDVGYTQQLHINAILDKVEEGTGGAAQQHFNVGKYNKLQLMLPPLEKQNEFVAFMEQVDKNMLIKKQANASYLENTDAKAAKLIQDSHLIYIYGMSIGETDRLWWDRICSWLAASGEHHLLLQKHGAPKKGVFPIKYQLYERSCRKDFSKHSTTLDQTHKESIESRIHITGENIFEDIKDTAVPVKTTNECAIDE